MTGWRRWARVLEGAEFGRVQAALGGPRQDVAGEMARPRRHDILEHIRGKDALDLGLPDVPAEPAAEGEAEQVDLAHVEERRGVEHRVAVIGNLGVDKTHSAP